MASNLQTFWTVKQTDDDEDLVDLVTTTSKLQISSNINSLFPYIDWDVRIDPAMMDRGVFAIGKTIEFIFDKTNIRTFRVLKVSAIPTLNTLSIPDTYTITLVSPWYFEQKIGSKIYYGKNTDILQEVAQTFSSTIKKVFCIPASEKESKLSRYRTYQTEGVFIDERVRPFFTGVSNHVASFIYVDEMQQFFATDEQEIFSSDLQNYAINIDHPHSEVLDSIRADPRKAERIIPIRGLGLFSNLNDALWANSKPSTMYMSSVPGQIKPATTLPVFSSLSAGTFLPITGSKSSNTTKIVMDDSQRVYSDIKATAQNIVKGDLFDSQGLVITSDLNLNVTVGQSVQVYVEATRSPNDTSKPSIYCQMYVISKVDHLIAATRGQTVFTCNCSAFSYDDAKTVLNYYRK